MIIEALRSIGVWLGTGPLAPVSTALGFLTTLAALGILILELTGRTISERRIARSNFKWNGTAVLVVIVMAAALVALNPLRFDFIHILQRGPRVAPSLTPVIAVVFGLPGVLGVILGMLVNALLQAEGGITPLVVLAAVWSALAWIWVTWLPYKMVGKLNFSTVRESIGTVGSFYLWAVVVGPLLHLWSSPVLQVVIQGGDASAIWARMVPMIAINHDLPYVVVGPIALAILYPLAKVLNLYWRDREEPAPVPA